MKPWAEVIGDPIGHSRSPGIHGFWLDHAGIDADYRATHVTPEGLGAYFELRRKDPDWRGCNITIPHKQQATGHVDRLEDDGIGAINCVVVEDGRLIGRNTDAGGFGSALPALAAGSVVAVIGGGGAAAAALAALSARRIGCNLIVRAPDQGEALLERLGSDGRVWSFDQAVEAVSGSHGLVNASPLGMNGFPAMPEAILSALSAIRPGGFVFDMVYAPLLTPLLETAEQRGLRAIDGLEMLIGQAALAFQYFFGARAPRERDSELRALLTR